MKRGCHLPIARGSFPKKPRNLHPSSYVQPNRPPRLAAEALARVPNNVDPLEGVFSRFKKDKPPEVVDVLEESSDIMELPRSSPSSTSSDVCSLPVSAMSTTSLVSSLSAQCESPANDEECTEVNAGKEDSSSRLSSSHVQSDPDEDIQIINETKSMNLHPNGVDHDEEEIICLSPPPIQNNMALEDSLTKRTVQYHRKVPRVWEVVKPLTEKANVKQTVLRICSYNVLCQETIKNTHYLYRHLGEDPSPLYWENRWPLLAENLEHIDADVFGLQEVQETHYREYFRPKMSELGYGAMFTAKNHPAVDGCALFYKRDKFEYVISSEVKYYVAENTHMDKPQIGQIIRLRCKVTKKELVVANTHIIFNMKRGDIKLGQISMLMAHIHREMTSNGPAPIILLGDFNIHPKSHIYNFIVDSTLFVKGLPRAELAGEPTRNRDIVQANDILPVQTKIGRDSVFLDNSRAPRRVPADTLTHPFELWSAYAPLLNKSFSRQEVSTYHADSGNPDFIFYSIKKKSYNGNVRNVVELPSLKLHRRMTLPRLDMLRKTLGPWPNQHVPSDHIPIVAEFIFKELDD